MDFRQYLDLLENLETEPQVGDVVEFECGDTLIETTIADLTEDGIIVHTDTTMMEMFVQGRRKINEMMRMGVDSDASASGSYKLGEEDMEEAKYQGREVKLGKPMKGDVAKSKVYVRGPKGNVVKVNFGDKNMRIKKSNPKRRKSFRARHNCDNPGPRWKARYWSCRAW